MALLKIDEQGESGVDDMESGNSLSILMERFKIHRQWEIDNPVDPIVVALWEQDAGKEETDDSLPQLKYYCPKCTSVMTKYEAVEDARYAEPIVLGFHVYHRGYGESWQCGPLKMYDPETDVIKRPLYP